MSHADLLIKTYPDSVLDRDGEVVKGTGGRVRRFVFSTDALDRDGEVILPAGIQVADYTRNPVVLWCHKADQPPIGRTVHLALDQGGRRLIGDIEFAKTALANEIWALYRDDFLKAVSVGLRPRAALPPTPEQVQARPDLARCWRVVSASALFEVSCVPIPANQEALMEAVAKGLSLSPEARGILMPDPTPDPTAAAPADRQGLLKTLSRFVLDLGGLFGATPDEVVKTLQDPPAAAAPPDPAPATPGPEPSADATKAGPAKEAAATQPGGSMTEQVGGVCLGCGQGKAECQCSGGFRAKDAADGDGDSGSDSDSGDGDADDKCAGCGQVKADCKCAGGFRKKDAGTRRTPEEDDEDIRDAAPPAEVAKGAVVAWPKNALIPYEHGLVTGLAEYDGRPHAQVTCLAKDAAGLHRTPFGISVPVDALTVVEPALGPEPEPVVGKGSFLVTTADAKAADIAKALLASEDFVPSLVAEAIKHVTAEIDLRRGRI